MKIEEIKRRIDLADYVRFCGLELIKAGKDLKAVCPFHNDTDPSLIITPSKQLWNCCGCGKGGSIIDFAMNFHNTDVSGAVKILSDFYGEVEIVQSPEKNSAKMAGNRNEIQLTQARENQLITKAIDFYGKTLAANPTGKKYLKSRGITDARLFEQHRIGFADGSLRKTLPAEGKILEELEAIGILIKNEKTGQFYERFKDCVVFPVCDVDGGIVTLYGRYTGQGNKRHVYLPGKSKGYWNIGVARHFKSLYLVESVIDALSLLMTGIENVVSIQSANVPKELNSLFSTCGVTSFFSVFDGDEAGVRGREQLKEKLKYFYHFPKVLPENEDPNSILMKEGPDKLISFLVAKNEDQKPEDSTVEKSDDGFSIQLGKHLYIVSGIEKTARKLRATIRVEKADKLHVDSVDFYSAKQRKQLVSDLSKLFNELPEEIAPEVDKLLKLCEQTASDSKRTSAAENEDGEEKIVISAEEEKEARELGKSPDLIKSVLNAFEKCGLIGETINKQLCYLVMTSRKMDDPLAVLILSSSGAGKTALQDATLKFCPPEDLVKRTAISEKALFNKGEFSLQRKVLALEEGAGAEDAAYAIRNLISSDMLTSETTIRDPKTGLLTTQEKRVVSQTAVFCTTTNPDTDPETKSRFFVIGIDESREQTRKILEFQRKRHTIHGLKEDVELKNTLHVHQNFQRLLKPYRVINPMAEQLAYDDDRLQSRRAQPQYLNLIKAVAFLRQMSKPVKKHKEKEYIEVDETDIEIGNSLALEVIGKSLDELSIPGRNLLDLLLQMMAAKRKEFEDKNEGKRTSSHQLTFTRRELSEFTGWTRTRLRNHLKELMEFEYAIMVSGRTNSLQHYQLIYEGEGHNEKRFIPGLKLKEK